MILLPQYLDFLIENNINERQYFLLQCLYDRKLDLITRYEEFLIRKSIISIEETNELVSKKFLIKTENGYTLGSKFLEIFIDDIKAANEIFSIYPSFISDHRNIQIPLTSMDRVEFSKIYISKINGSIFEHFEIIKDIKYAKSKDLIKIGIEKFLRSEQWKAFRTLRYEDKLNNIKELPSKDFN